MGQNLGPLNIKDSYQSLVQISGSIITDGTGSAINSLDMIVSAATSASYATTATSASHAVSANSALTATSASYALTASYAANVPVTASYAISASHANNADSSLTSNTASFAHNANTANSATTASYALTSSYATSASQATSASYAATAANANTSAQTDAIYQIISTDDAFVPLMVSNAVGLAGYFNVEVANNVGVNNNTKTLNLANITASGYISASDIVASTSIITSNLNATSLTASLANISTLTATSASIGYLQTVTGSATIIGDAFIILNTGDAQRYAGLLVEDSGSAVPVNYTASWYFDSDLNDWNYEYTTTASTDYAVAMFGPAYSTKGSPTYLTANTLPKAEGGHHLVDSIISDDGTKISVAGAVSASAGFTGSLHGNADTATSASYAPFTTPTLQQVTTAGSSSTDTIYVAGVSTNYVIPQGGDLTLGGIGGDVYFTAGGAGKRVIIEGQNGILSNSTITISGSESKSLQIRNKTVTRAAVSFEDATTLDNTQVNVGAIGDNLYLKGEGGVQVTGSLILLNGLDSKSGLIVTGSVKGNVDGLTITSQTASLDCSSANFFTLTLVSGSDTHVNASNIKAGQTINLKVVQPNPGFGTISFSNNFAFPSGSTYVGTAATDAVDIVSMVAFDTTKLYANQVENLV